MISSVPTSFPMYGIVVGEDEMCSSTGEHPLDDMPLLSSPPPSHPLPPAPPHPQPHSSFLYNFSILKDKVNQLQSFINLILSQSTQSLHLGAASVAVSGMAALIQEVITVASSLMFLCQQMALSSTTPNGFLNQQQQQKHQDRHHNVRVSDEIQGGSIRPAENGYAHKSNPFDSASNSNNNKNNSSDSNNNPNTAIDHRSSDKEFKFEDDGGIVDSSYSKEENGDSSCYDIVEMDAAELLAEYTHYCHICGKGFKRDANLRMHMRAHGDEYKTNAALSKPSVNGSPSSSGFNRDYASSMNVTPRKYSCPQEGCRWNKKHAKFTPLKSMICVKNHYKRSHCPKMYVCNRCNRKKFSVLSDLRTHEKHCGDLKWQCSCGTTFSRKDKLLGHVALFVGHTPIMNCGSKIERNQQQVLKFQLDER